MFSGPRPKAPKTHHEPTVSHAEGHTAGNASRSRPKSKSLGSKPLLDGHDAGFDLRRYVTRLTLVNAVALQSEHTNGMKARGWLQQYDWLMIVWATCVAGMVAFMVYVAFFVP